MDQEEKDCVVFAAGMTTWMRAALNGPRILNPIRPTEKAACDSVGR